MGINTDLNIDPYFDDFDETKQFNRVLFRPARAVQARELTQLQTILQNQVERFGSNIYKEGTVVSGANISLRPDIFYVKITDSGISDPTIYSQAYDANGDEVNYVLEGQKTGLRAEIVLGENGFETRDPNLKTFYIVYTNTTVVEGNEAKQFAVGETLTLIDPNGTIISNASITVATVNNHAGRSVGLEIKEGIIFQKGHFLFAEEQFVIVSKYDSIPDNVSVGFKVEESIVGYAEDTSLLDNAQGFNNFNAPGADRLRLRPILTAVPSGSEPEEFFALTRFSNGEQITLRDVTEFNAVATAMARRTYEESGNYVIRGMDVSLDARGLDDEGNPETYAVVSPGKAYAFGYEVQNMAPRFLRIPYETETVKKTGQGITASYGQYFQVEMDASDALNAFTFSTTPVALKDGNDNQIGTCFIRNIEPGKFDGQGNQTEPGRVYVFGVVKDAGEENTPIYKVADTPIKQVFIPPSTPEDGNGTPIPLQGTRNSALIFNGGNPNTKAITNISFTKRIRGTISNENTLNTNNNTFIIPNTDAYTPTTRNIVLVDNVSNVVPVVSTTQNLNGDITVTYDPDAVSANDPGDPSFYYFDAVVVGAGADVMQQMNVYVKTVINSDGIAQLGLPNTVRINSIINQGNNGQGTSNITGRFILVNNQKDGYYDKSYMKLKPGSTAPAGDNILLVNMTVLRRVSTTGNGYLDASSYANVDKELVRGYSSKEGKKYNLLASVDFRPYAVFDGSYALSAQGAENVGSATDLAFNAFTPIANETVVSGDIEYFLPRFDAVAVDSLGKFALIKGEGSENPSIPSLKDVFTLADIYVPGQVTALRGDNALRLKSRSTRNYTMRDIEKIDKQLDRLTEAVSLSLLENATKDLVITDANGNSRFKNGILVDGFRNTDVADVTDAEFKAAVDKTYRVAMPSILQFPIDLDLADSGNQSVQSWADITLLADTGTPVEMIKQPYGTDYRNAVSNYYNYQGKMQLFPEFDSGYDVVNNPAVNIDIDMATPILDLVDNLQEFVPLTRSNSSSISSSTSATGGGGTTITTTTTTTTVTDSLVNEVTESTQSVGDFVTDIAFKPFLERRMVRVFVTGLRPNTIHHIFFDERNVDEFTRPAVQVRGSLSRAGSLTPRSVFPVGRTTDKIRSNSQGVLAAFFEIPAKTFYVGEHEVRIADVDLYSSISSGATSGSKGTYRGYNFDVSKTELTVTTRTPSFDIDTTVSTTNNTTSRFVPDPPPPPQNNGGGEGGNGGGPGGSCFVAGTQVTMEDGTKRNIEDILVGDKLLGQDGEINEVKLFDHWPLDGRDLIGINGSGPFKTPEHPLMTRDGWKAFDSEITKVEKPQIAHLMVNGSLEVGDELLMEDGSWVKIESLEVHSNEEEQTVYNFVLDGNNTYFANGILAHNRDPISQTFFVKRGMAKGATTVFIRNIDIFFKGRANTDTTMADVTINGVTIELREVINGYPSDAILPFGLKHLTPAEVNVSQDGSVATTVQFDNPIRLNVEKEYAFVVRPDANDPNYLVFTSKVGGTDLVSGLSVTQDWGDGVLFTSTNNRAWKSYQDEDIKFNLRRLEFSTNAGSVNFVPKKYEFFTVESNVGDFLVDELVYATKSGKTSYLAAWTPYNLTAADPVALPVDGFGSENTEETSVREAQTVTVPETTVDFAQGDYVLMTQGAATHLAKVLTLTKLATETTLLLDAPPSASLDADSTATTTIQGVVAGKVAYYNDRRPELIHLKESSATSSTFFRANDNIVGFDSGSTATVTSVDDVPISYFQPVVYQSNTSRTSTEYRFKNDDAQGTFRTIPSSDATYLTNGVRVVNSHSNIQDAGNVSVDEQSFVVQVAMSNNGFTTASPIIDDDISRANVYQYQITELVNSSSAYVSKKVILQESIEAVGMKVLMAAYRPQGTMVDVYARFTYPANAEADSDWVKLDLASNAETLYSSTSNIRDYREFEYNLDEATYTDEYSSFQIKIVMRHATDQEMSDQGITGVTPDVHLFPHVFDYRAIALT